MTPSTSRPAQEDFDSKSTFSTSTISSTKSLLKGMFTKMIQVSNKKPDKPENRKSDGERELASKDNEPMQRPLYINGTNATGKILSLRFLSVIRRKLGDEDINVSKCVHSTYRRLTHLYEVGRKRNQERLMVYGMLK